MSWRMTLTACLLALSGMMSPGGSRAQDDLFGEAPPPAGPPRRVQVFERATAHDPWSADNLKFKIAAAADGMRQIEDAAAAVRDAEGKEEKSDARKKLWKLLDDYFEQDMQRRAEELALIEQRVKKLHALLERRADKKDDIIDLQMQVLENEADGLGFFNHTEAAGVDRFLFVPKEGRLRFDAAPATPRPNEVRVRPPAGLPAAPPLPPLDPQPAPAVRD